MAPNHATYPLANPLGAEDQLFFLHIPKTAGTTLAAIVENVFNREMIFPYYFTYELVGQDITVFSQYHYFRGHFPHALMQRLLPRPAITITMLRDPVERFLSHIGQINRQPNPTVHIRYLQALPLAELVEDETACRLLRDLQVRMLAADPQPQIEQGRVTAVQTPMKMDIQPGFLRSAQTNLAGYAFAGLTERFQESLFLLAYLFNWRPIMDYPSLNVAGQRTRSSSLPAALLDRIQALNHHDQQLYAMGATLFEARYQQMQHDLLQQYGTAADAQQKLPLKLETVFDLLERRYADQYARTRTLVSQLDLPLHEGIQGTGWHLAEKNADHGWYRWTGPETVSTLDLPLHRDAPLGISIDVMQGITPEVLDSLELRINDVPVPVVRSRKNTFPMTFTGRMPRQAGRGFTRLSLVVKKTETPQSFDAANPDTRALGVAVMRLRIWPVKRWGWLRQRLKRFLIGFKRRG